MAENVSETKTEEEGKRMKKLNEALQKALDLSLEPVSIELLRTLFSEMKSFRSEELLRSLQDQINFNLKENILKEFKKEMTKTPNLPHLLSDLDRLEDNYNSFTPMETEEDPKRKIAVAIIRAKQQEVIRLKALLHQLETEKEEMKPVVVDNSTLITQIEGSAKEQDSLLDEKFNFRQNRHYKQQQHGYKLIQPNGEPLPLSDLSGFEEDLTGGQETKETLQSISMAKTQSNKS